MAQFVLIVRVLYKANKEVIKPILNQRITCESVVITDGFGPYRTLGKEFKKHVAINHEKRQKKKGKYNLSSIEGFWAMLKRAVMGVYHSISETHLQSYVNEISFKFNNRGKDMFNLLIKNMLDIKCAVSW